MLPIWTLLIIVPVAFSSGALFAVLWPLFGFRLAPGIELFEEGQGDEDS